MQKIEQIETREKRVYSTVFNPKAMRLWANSIMSHTRALQLKKKFFERRKRRLWVAQYFIYRPYLDSNM